MKPLLQHCTKWLLQVVTGGRLRQAESSDGTQDRFLVGLIGLIYPKSSECQGAIVRLLTGGFGHRSNVGSGVGGVEGVEGVVLVVDDGVELVRDPLSDDPSDGVDESQPANPPPTNATASARETPVRLRRSGQNT